MKKRYFFVSTLGTLPNGSFSFNNFDIVTTYGHPTMKRCLEISKEKYPEQYSPMLISISEMSQEDFERFVSEQ